MTLLMRTNAPSKSAQHVQTHAAPQFHTHTAQRSSSSPRPPPPALHPRWTPVKWWAETLSRCAVEAMRPSAPGRLQGSRSACKDRARWRQAHTRASQVKVGAKQALSLPGGAHTGSSPTGKRLRRLCTNRPLDSQAPSGGPKGYLNGVDSDLPVACLCAAAGEQHCLVNTEDLCHRPLWSSPLHPSQQGQARMACAGK